MSGVRFFFCAGLLLLCALAPHHAQGGALRGRQRRSLGQLSSMVNDVTGRQSTDFISYGNWCGLGGSGRTLDPIDQCCQIHDLCYDVSLKGACREKGEKAPYQMEYGWQKGRDGGAHCDEESDRCKSSVCMCDTMLTNCLKDNLESYDPKKLHKLSFYELLQEANWVSNP